MINDSALLHLQTVVLEAVAYGEPLAVVADLICRRAEAMAPGATCSILSVDGEQRLHPLAGPSLPLAYSSALDGLLAGPAAGSCGTAAFFNAEVVVTNIQTDPLWKHYRDLATPLGLTACWSSPIRSREGDVLATFAFYYRVAREPNEMERRIVQTCVHLCAIAIEHERSRAHIHQLAYYDVLTGLPNRARFGELLAQHIALAQPFALLLVDIDHLKLVNDTVGHVVGDMLIQAVAARIASSDPRMTACRLGGDEFAILVDACSTEDDLEQITGRMFDAVRGLIRAGDQTMDPHVTAGGALFGPDGIDAATLSQNADFALYHAKETRRGGFVRFQPGLRTAITERANTVRSVDLALLEGRMLAHYQPIVRIDTGEIVGLEALARMRMPDGRIAAAGEFHAAMADPRIAWELTGQMLVQVARDIRHWLEMGIPFQHVGVNVTTGDFARGDLEQRIVDAFGEAGVPLNHVVLEVNEAVFMGGSDHMVARAVGALRQRGLLVALDDFGTGFASLTHLLSFPVDIIKIDRSFVDKLVTDPSSRVICGAVTDIARRLNMRVVAEGIETSAQGEALLELGCLMGQGYHFSRPCGVGEVTRLLELFVQRPALTPVPLDRTG
jgi:diguanylate cyclase (GGDEF)-like protein